MKKKHRAKSIIATLLCELKYIIIEKHLSDTNGHSAKGQPYFWYESCALQTKSIYCSKTNIISKSRNNLKTDIIFSYN